MLYQLDIESVSGAWWFRRAVGTREHMVELAHEEAECDELEFEEYGDNSLRVQRGYRRYFIHPSRELVATEVPGEMRAPYPG